MKMADWDRPGFKDRPAEAAPALLPLITNWPPKRRRARALLEHYRRRGPFEDRLGKSNARTGNGLSAAAFEANEAALLSKLLAFTLARMIRGELEGSSGNGWDLKRVQRTVVKTAARVTERGRRLVVNAARTAGFLWARVGSGRTLVA